MQDKQRNHEFEDYAWSEMRSLLDREMPVTGGRRRPFAWLALLLLLLGAIGIGWFGWSQMRASVVPEERALESPAASDQAVAQESIPVTGLSEDIPQEKGPVSGSPGEEREAPFFSQGAKPPATSFKDDLISLSTPERRGIESVDPLPEPDVSISLERSKPDELSSGLPIKIPETGGNKSRQRRLEAVIPPTFIAELALPQEVRASSLSSLEKPGISQGATSKRFFLLPDEWGVQSEALAGSGEWPSGFALGMTGGYRLGHSRWSLETGIQYRYDNRAFDRQTIRDRTVAEDETAVPTSPNTDNEDLEDSGFGQVGSNYQLPGDGEISVVMQSFNLPVFLQYRLNNRISLHTGFQLNYLLRATRRTTLDFSPSRLNSFQDEELTALFSTGADQPIDNQLFKQFEVGISTGMHYRIGADWQLHLRYHYGLSDLLRSDYYQTYHRYAGLGLTYFFK